jgi:hypothetical protein
MDPRRGRLLAGLTRWNASAPIKALAEITATNTKRLVSRAFFGSCG